jgi:hypothetical protein
MIRERKTRVKSPEIMSAQKSYLSQESHVWMDIGESVVEFALWTEFEQ